MKLWQIANSIEFSGNWKDRTGSAVSLGFDCIGLAGAAATLVPRPSPYGRVGMRVAATGLLANYLFVQPALDDLDHALHDGDNGSRISHAVALPFDAIGAAGATALALGKGNPRMAVMAMGIGVAGHYLSKFLPIYSTMSVTRADGDPRPPLQY